MFPAIKKNPVDWPAVVNDLVRGGYSIPAIHARIGIPETTIKGWRNVGAEPLHNSGELLIELWCNATLRDKSQIPRTNRPPPKPAVFRRSSWIQLPLIE